MADLFKADNYVLITFNSAQQALRAESLLEKQGYEFILVPTPRELAAGCGLSLKFWPNKLGQARAALALEGVVTEKFFTAMKEANGIKFIELI